MLAVIGFCLSFDLFARNLPLASATEARFRFTAALLLLLCYAGFEFKPFKRDGSHAGPVPIVDNNQKDDGRDKA